MDIRIMSADEIQERIDRNKLPENAAIISFYDPEPLYDNDYSGAVDLKGFAGRAILVPVEDIEERELSRHGYDYESFLPEAAAIADFIYNAVNDGCIIICQCYYGISRSAGCAAAILEHFERNGISIFANEEYFPNRLIYHKIFNALNEHWSKCCLNILLGV